MTNLILIYLLIVPIFNTTGYAIFEDSEIYHQNKTLDIVYGLTKIIKLITNSLVIYDNGKTTLIQLGTFLNHAHQNNIKTCIFSNSTKYFEYIEAMLSASIETTSLIFDEPDDIVGEILSNNLAHRISLYIFYWGATKLNYKWWHFPEPLRVVILTQPIEKLLRVYYNQATPDGKGKLTIVNRCNCDDLSISKNPLLPSAMSVYKNFNGRVFYIPVIHSPPWHFVTYARNVSNNLTAIPSADIQVTAGRDFNLLKLISKKMRFQFQYIDPPERTQGTAADSFDNLTFSGALGMLQRREADLLLGDISLTWDRRRVVDFSFFTLVDSGAFATHAPRRSNEALALIRPFRWDVWSPLIFTFFITGPIFYIVIAAPFWWAKGSTRKCRAISIRKNRNVGICNLLYLNEITYGYNPNRTFRKRKLRNMHLVKKDQQKSSQLPDDLLNKCIWFTVTLFLRQSSIEPYDGLRARFLTTIFWLSASYVIGDVYSAQLTSQLARPPRELPINNLQRLEYAMKYNKYQLYVERQSSSLEMLENGTEIFKRLFYLMESQSKNSKNGIASYLVSSVEEGIKLIKNSNRAVLGGRETLHYNIKKRGLQDFQISENLYTRYSAVAVQSGCPFLESLNEILLRLFEGGILEKITDSEYEKMFKYNRNEHELRTDNKTWSMEHQKQESIIDSKMEPLNIRMLQGAFVALAMGYFISTITFIYEINIIHRRQKWYRYFFRNLQRGKIKLEIIFRQVKAGIREIITKFYNECNI